LKWAGGKKQLLSSLVGRVPVHYNKYIEPMLGGGALYFKLLPKKAILADSNEELINCYLIVRDKLHGLISELKNYKNEESFYYAVRNQQVAKLNPVQRAARTIYLNKTCYNGLFRVNKAGNFNVPFGKRINPKILDEPNLLAASNALQNIEIIAGDYKAVLKKYARKGDFIYLDPPYYPAGGYADFKRYTKEFFYEEDHIELRDEFCRLLDIGCSAILTNSNTDFVRQLYEGFNYEAIDTRRNISSKALTRTGQDLIVCAGSCSSRSKPQKLELVSERLLAHFPGTRYMGSKYRLLPFIWDCVKDLEFSSVLDAFSGSACVSYMFKQYGKRVTSNDFLHFAYYFAKALIENQNIVLDRNDIDLLMRSNPKAGNFIADTFRGLYFNEAENNFLDSLIENIKLLNNPYKKALALAAISRACMKRRARGIFTFVGDKYNDGRRDMRINLQQQFIENIEAFNLAVFDNGKKNMSLNCDVFDLDKKADLVYLDPPYFTPNSDNDYTRRYHFVEGLVRQWQGIEILYGTKTKKFRRYDTPFISRHTAYEAFDRLFDKFKNSIIVLSYSSNSIPNKADLTELLKKYKKYVRVHQVEYLYSFGTHHHKIGSNANRAREFIFVAY
jgi:DNA adenine methylase